MQKLFGQNKAKTIAAAVALVFAAACQAYLIQKQIVYIMGLLKLRDQLSGIGSGLSGLGSLLGGALGSLGDALTIPASFYVHLALPIIGAVLLILIFAKFALPLGNHRFVLLGLVAVYVLQSGYSVLNSWLLQNSDSALISLLFKPAPLSARTVIFMVLTPCLVLLVGLIINKGLAWFRVGAAAVCLASAVNHLLQGLAAAAEGRDNVGMVLSIAAPLFFAAAILLHPVLEESMYILPWDRVPAEHRVPAHHVPAHHVPAAQAKGNK